MGMENGYMSESNRETVLKFQHSSLQYSDGSKKQRHDIEKLFEFGQDFPIKTGTEAGPDAPSHNSNRYILQEVAKKHRHRLVFWRDNWIAVHREIIQPGSVTVGSVFVADTSETAGHGHDSGFPTFSFEHIDPNVGEVNIAACHMPVRGRVPGDPNYEINVRYSNMLGLWARKAGKGTALAFVVGDYNRLDNKEQDWVVGTQRLTSAPDELGGPWQNTGHGAIDGHMSYDRDGRVTAKWVSVLNDKEFFLYADHFVVRTAFSVRHLG